ncbi:MAG: T9SS type A sorting domain-containing protein [Bacteroidetes bacterium]|nr:T9SS type A sorting domain-containing protein [Bacteroidota bacterium]
MTLTLPSCTWTSERTAQTPFQTQPTDTLQKAATGMLVYPNPAKSSVTVNYDYGYASDINRSIVLYDMTGRLITNMEVKDVTGAVTINTSELPGGSYIVGMREQGRMVEVGHLTITH